MKSVDATIAKGIRTVLEREKKSVNTIFAGYTMCACVFKHIEGHCIFTHFLYHK